jgi:hypothetical protein
VAPLISHVTGACRESYYFGLTVTHLGLWVVVHTSCTVVHSAAYVIHVEGETILTKEPAVLCRLCAAGSILLRQPGKHLRPLWTWTYLCCGSLFWLNLFVGTRRVCLVRELHCRDK